MREIFYYFSQSRDARFCVSTGADAGWAERIKNSLYRQSLCAALPTLPWLAWLQRRRMQRRRILRLCSVSAVIIRDSSLTPYPFLSHRATTGGCPYRQICKLIRGVFLISQIRFGDFAFEQVVCPHLIGNDHRDKNHRHNQHDFQGQRA